MRKTSGFTLIEVMVALAIVAILAAVAFPSYQSYVRRGIRAQGQVFLVDLAQRQEQFFLDQRRYATDIGGGSGELSFSVPAEVSKHYTLQRPFTVSNASGAPPTFVHALTPNAGDQMATSNDGSLLINNLGTRWRERDGDGSYAAGNDCRWDESTCVPH
jgi:type IV pilus assembly protein PilE